MTKPHDSTSLPTAPSERAGGPWGYSLVDYALTIAGLFSLFCYMQELENLAGALLTERKRPPAPSLLKSSPTPEHMRRDKSCSFVTLIAMVVGQPVVLLMDHRGGVAPNAAGITK